MNQSSISHQGDMTEEEEDRTQKQIKWTYNIKLQWDFNKTFLLKKSIEFHVIEKNFRYLVLLNWQYNGFDDEKWNLTLYTTQLTTASKHSSIFSEWNKVAELSFLWVFLLFVYVFKDFFCDTLKYLFFKSFGISFFISKTVFKVTFET